MKIISEPQNLGVNICQMKDGDFAVITKWTEPQYVGQIVQRTSDNLITPGQPSYNGWGSVFNGNKLGQGKYLTECLVRILPPGTKLEI